MRLAIAFFTCGFFMAVIETFLYPQLFSLYGVMGMIGPVIAGFLCSRCNPKWVLGAAYGLRPVLVVLFLLFPKTEPLVYAFVIGLGLVGNASVPPTTFLIARLFGSRKMPTLSGLAMVFHQAGSAASTWQLFLHSHCSRVCGGSESAAQSFAFQYGRISIFA